MSVQKWILALFLAAIVSLALTETAFAQSPRALPADAPPASNLRTQVATKAKEEKKLKGTWNLRLQQRRFEDPFNQRSLTEFRLLADLQYYPL